MGIRRVSPDKVRVGDQIKIHGEWQTVYTVRTYTHRVEVELADGQWHPLDGQSTWGIAR